MSDELLDIVLEVLDDGGIVVEFHDLGVDFRGVTRWNVNASEA